MTIIDLIGAMIIIWWLIILPIVIVNVVANAKIFKKADEEWYYYLIPFLSQYTRFDIAMDKGFLGLLTIPLLFIQNFCGKPEVSLLCSVGVSLLYGICDYCLAKRFGKSIGFSIITGIFGLTIIFNPFIWYLGFSSDQYMNGVISKTAMKRTDGKNNYGDINKYLK